MTDIGVDDGEMKNKNNDKITQEWSNGTCNCNT